MSAPRPKKERSLIRAGEVRKGMKVAPSARRSPVPVFLVDRKPYRVEITWESGYGVRIFDPEDVLVMEVETLI